MASEIDTLRARVGALEGLCADAYQLAGTVGAPVRFLNALAAAAAGKRLPKVELLPVLETECDADPRARRSAGAGQKRARRISRRGARAQRRLEAEPRQDGGLAGERPQGRTPTDGAERRRFTS